MGSNPFMSPVQIAATPRFRVMQVRVAPPGGKAFDYTYIAPRNGVVVLPVLDDGKIVLIRNRRLPVDATLWELPAGVIEAGEDPSAADRKSVV